MTNGAEQAPTPQVGWNAPCVVVKSPELVAPVVYAVPEVGSTLIPNAASLLFPPKYVE